MSGNTRTWARIVNGTVAELTTTDPAGRYHPGLTWVDVSAVAGVAVGWVQQAAGFALPQAAVLDLAQAREDLAWLRLQKETAGVLFQASGAKAASVFATDYTSQAKLSAAFTMAGAGHWVPGTPWKDVTGAFVPMTVADIQALAVAVATHVAACYTNEARLATVLAATPNAAIAAGWPPGT